MTKSAKIYPVDSKTGEKLSSVSGKNKTRLVDSAHIEKRGYQPVASGQPEGQNPPKGGSNISRPKASKND